MQSVVIVPLMNGDEFTGYRAIGGGSQSDGRTAGQALDSLRAQSGASQAAALVIVQSLEADPFFSAVQKQRLQELMQCWRDARDAGQELTPSEQAELEALVDAELVAAMERTQSLIPKQGS